MKPAIDMSARSRAATSVTLTQAAEMLQVFAFELQRDHGIDARTALNLAVASLGTREFGLGGESSLHTILSNQRSADRRP